MNRAAPIGTTAPAVHGAALVLHVAEAAEELVDLFHHAHIGLVEVGLLHGRVPDLGDACHGKAFVADAAQLLA